MTYEETLEFLYAQLPMYQREGKSAYKKDLTNTIQLLEVLENPHKKFKSVHIGGTNGKGTCSHGIASILQLSGYKTGLYTSPHLRNFTERIRINGKEIQKSYVVDFVKVIKPHIERIQPSFFEITVAMAFWYFAEQSVDIAVVEVGLGGRLDSTNVVTPEACLITNIGFDHMDLLGDTLDKIAFEKAGIIKNGVPVVIGKYQEETFPVFIKKAKEMNASLILNHNFGSEVSAALPEKPYHKALNYNAVITLAFALKTKGWNIQDEHITEGYKRLEELTGLKGRFQILKENPLTIADVSHNQDGLNVLFQAIHSIRKGRIGKLHLIYGTVKERDLETIFKLFPKDAKIYWTQSSTPRSLPVDALAKQGHDHQLEGESFRNVNEAISKASSLASPNDIILVTGSTFVVAEVEDL